MYVHICFIVADFLNDQLNFTPIHLLTDIHFSASSRKTFLVHPVKLQASWCFGGCVTVTMGNTPAVRKTRKDLAAWSSSCKVSGQWRGLVVFCMTNSVGFRFYFGWLVGFCVCVCVCMGCFLGGCGVRCLLCNNNNGYLAHPISGEPKALTKSGTQRNSTTTTIFTRNTINRTLNL